MSKVKHSLPVSSIIKEDSFLNILSFMVTELNLKGVKLFAYAIIYGFSQSKRGYFDGSVKYICAWSNSGETAVRQALKELTEEGLINKIITQQNNVVFNNYSANRRPVFTLSESDRPYQKVIGGVSESDSPPLSESDSNILEYYNLENNIKSAHEINSANEYPAHSASLTSPTSSAQDLPLLIPEIALNNLSVTELIKRVGKPVAEMFQREAALFNALTEEQQNIVLDQYEQKKRLKKAVKSKTLTDLAFVKKYPIEVIREMHKESMEKGWEHLTHHDIAKKIIERLERDKATTKNEQTEQEAEISDNSTKSATEQLKALGNVLSGLKEKVSLETFSQLGFDKVVNVNIAITEAKGSIKRFLDLEGSEFRNKHYDKILKAFNDYQSVINSLKPKGGNDEDI